MLQSLFFFSIVSFAEETPLPEQAYPCIFTSAPITIDGSFDEPSWRKASKLPFTIFVTSKKSVNETEARMLWDKNYLYVAFMAYDKDIWSYYKKRDAPTCEEDALEIFFQTHPGKEPYYSFEINALGTIFDEFAVRRWKAGGHHRWSKWDAEGMKVAVKVKGTLNNWQDKDEYWQMEVAIPFSSLLDLEGKTPKEGEFWKFLLARCNYSIDLPEGKEFSCCVSMPKGSAHYYEGWPFLKLTLER